LREFIQRRQRQELLKLFGAVDYDAAYDYKKDRRRTCLGSSLAVPYIPS
jgi:hypothetical protein